MQKRIPVLSRFNPKVRAAAEIALRVGKKVELMSRNPHKLTVTVKHDAGYGHSAASTSGDILAQRLILKELRKKFPDAYFLTEEKPDTGDSCARICSSLDPDALPWLLFGVDPIDGTSEFKGGGWEFSISIGCMCYGLHIGGAIYAPSVRGGVLVVGEREKGVFVSEGGRRATSAHVSSCEGKSGVVYVGCDFHWLTDFKRFEVALAKQVNRVKSIGSCALGLAAVAAGKIDVLIQPVQKPWDWFAGYPLVEEAGGKLQFYHYRECEIVPLARPDLAAYDTDKPNVAFIAGNPRLVDWIFELLQETYRKY